MSAHVFVHTDFPLLALVANTELHALSADQAAPALALREQSRELLLRVLDQGARQGSFSVRDTTLAAVAIGSLGIRVANWFGPDAPYTREQVADSYAEFALRIVGASGHPPAPAAEPAASPDA